MILNGNKLPDQFTWTVEQIATITGASEDTIRRNIKRKPEERHYIRGRQNTPGGPYVVFAADLEDYLKRTEVGYLPEKAVA